VHNYSESGFDYAYDKQGLDQQEVNSGDGAKDQFEQFRLEEEKGYSHNRNITVSEPHEVSGYFVYKIKGSDEKGEFEVE
jgi:hypothetical protein